MLLLENKHNFRYNVEDSNINDTNFEKLDKQNVPDVILVKKHYGDKAARRKQRIWKLRHLAEEDTALNTDAKYGIGLLLTYCFELFLF